MSRAKERNELRCLGRLEDGELYDEDEVIRGERLMDAFYRCFRAGWVECAGPAGEYRITDAGRARLAKEAS